MPPKSLGTGTGGPQDLPTHHHPTTTPIASVLVVGLCSWFSFAFSFKTELSPWELVRRALAGGGAQGTWPILQGRFGGPPFPGNLSAVVRTSLLSLNASQSVPQAFTWHWGLQLFPVLAMLVLVVCGPTHACLSEARSCSHIPPVHLLCSTRPEQLAFST